MNTSGSRFRGMVALWVTVVAAMVTQAAQAAQAGAPLISLSLRGVAERTVEQGEPLSVAVRISAPRRAGRRP